jgi:hypothetical protein
MMDVLYSVLGTRGFRSFGHTQRSGFANSTSVLLSLPSTAPRRSRGSIRDVRGTLS